MTLLLVLICFIYIVIPQISYIFKYYSNILNISQNLILCLQWWKEYDYKWNDTPCNTGMSAVCQMPGISVINYSLWKKIYLFLINQTSKLADSRQITPSYNYFFSQFLFKLYNFTGQKTNKQTILIFLCLFIWDFTSRKVRLHFYQTVYKEIVYLFIYKFVIKGGQEKN